MEPILQLTDYVLGIAGLASGATAALLSLHVICGSALFESRKQALACCAVLSGLAVGGLTGAVKIDHAIDHMDHPVKRVLMISASPASSLAKLTLGKG